MSESASPDLGDIDLALARRIDAICRRYEAERRAGRSPSIGDYLGDVPETGRQALRRELEALDCELRQATEQPTDPDGPQAPAAADVSPVGAAGDAAGLPVPDQPTVATPGPGDAATEVLSGPRDRPHPEAPGPFQIRYFGDYEILREIARGGMGVVFLARQVSLNRPVAVKMILAGQLADEADVRRFYTEAEAAANLDHPGIVPIHEVGQHQGQHYFSMGFVDGPSLAQRLAEGPIPPREAAELMARVAEAIAYAHRSGLIHRDIKPGNILLDRDGSPRITDFGLAKKVEGDSALTASGQVMGTPSYMPPEQAGGQGAAAGPEADVYAIGATLYALATGRPPFQAATPTDTILQVIHQEPVPPRRLNPGIPRDLETICLKCLEKDPARRYATAEALVGELRRFLAGKPILARPVGLLERAWRWSRRNRLAAALITVVALLTATGATTIIGLWLRADHSRQVAVSAEGRTRLALAQAVAAGERADLARAEAVAAGRRAEASAATARQAVNGYLDRITEYPQLKRPGLLGLRRDLLSLALGYYEGFLRESAADPQLRAESAAARHRVAMILNEMGDTRRSLDVARQAVALGEELVREHPDRVDFQHLLAASLNSLASPLRTERQPEDAVDAYRRGIAILEALVKSHPDNIEAAEDLAMQTSNLATILGDLGRTEESVTLLTRNRARLEDLVGRKAGEVRARDLLAGVLHSLGDRAADRGGFDEARGLYLRALEIREAVVREHPDDWEEQSQLARINNELGILHFHFHRPDEALSYYQKGREIRERLLAAEPASFELQEYLARSLENLGNLYNSLGRPSEALPVLERCRDLRARFVAANPGNFEVRGSLGGSLHNLAMSYERLDRLGDAERLYREALEHQRRAFKAQPQHMRCRAFLTNHLMNLGDLLRRTGRLDEAAGLADEAAGLWPRHPRQLIRPALLLSSCVGSATGDSADHRARRDRLGRRAVEILTRAFDAGFRDPSFYREARSLDPIRDRDDFRALLRRLDSPAKTSSR